MNNQRRNPFGSLDGAVEPIDLIPVARKVQRNRAWEKKNRAYSYKIPQRLRDLALEVRASILSIATYDEKGHSRMDRTTVDDVAKVLIAYSLKKAKDENLIFAPTRTGKMKLEWEEAEQGWESPIILKKVEKKRKKGQTKQIFLAYRWAESTHSEIEKLAGVNRDVRYRDDGSAIPDPYRFLVPSGEVVVRLLQRAIKAYEARRLVLSSQPETVEQRVIGWAER
ncbi:MAG: hypothetical protein HN392_11375 [Anaerolineae bacterium]|nr:hypothetical protein [Anaerolineae bacterium]MBT7783469.1 hypothetical protein [Anaerolineae bacterium]